MTCAILLAAGRSQRMGCQKLLLPFAGRTVVGHIARELLASGLDHTIVVVGKDATLIADALRQATKGEGGRLTIITNPDLEADMLSSVRCGLRALPDACDTVLVALGDQPSITARLIDQLLAAFSTAAGGILVPVYDGETGHPILFSTRYRREVLTCYDSVGLRGLLQGHPDDVVELPVEDSAILSDMDYPEDYRKELERQSALKTDR